MQCPKCGAELIRKNSRSGGTFLACPRFPDCHYTTSVPGKQIKVADEWDMQERPTHWHWETEETPKPTCQKCGGSGLVPFIKPDETTSQYAKSFCECSVHATPESQRNYGRLRPEDIDYPVSYSHWRALCVEHGWPEPGPDREEARAVIEAKQPPQTFQPASKVLEEMRAELSYLRNKVTELRVEKKQKDNGDFVPF